MEWSSQSAGVVRWYFCVAQSTVTKAEPGDMMRKSPFEKLPHPISNTLLMVRRLSGGFYEDGLLTIANSDFRKDDHFRNVYAAAKATGSFSRWNLRWRIHVLCWAANHGHCSMAISLSAEINTAGPQWQSSAYRLRTHRETLLASRHIQRIRPVSAYRE